MNLAAQIQERLKGILPELLGIKLVEVTPDKVVAQLTVRPDLCTTGKILHGGSIMAFADTLGAIGTVVNMPQGHGTATIESKTNFLGGAAEGSVVTGEVHAGAQGQDHAGLADAHHQCRGQARRAGDADADRDAAARLAALCWL